MNNSIGGVKNRRARTLQRLENQLKTGTKTAKSGDNAFTGSYGAFQEALTDSDINRINKEIAVLKTRI